MSPSLDYRLLIVEDRSGYAELLKEALTAHGLADSTKILPDVASAWTFLRQAANSSGHTLPKLVMLDLSLADATGRDLLRRVRNSPALASLPIVMLTSSSDPVAVRACYGSGANAYIVKPDTFDDLVMLMGDLARFWLRWNRFPSSVA